jgi:hypothetical protein
VLTHSRQQSHKFHKDQIGSMSMYLIGILFRHMKYMLRRVEHLNQMETVYIEYPLDTI